MPQFLKTAIAEVPNSNEVCIFSSMQEIIIIIIDSLLTLIRICFYPSNSETWSGYLVKVKVQLMSRILDQLIIHRDAGSQHIISHTKTLKDISHQLSPFNLQDQNVSANFISVSISISLTLT